MNHEETMKYLTAKALEEFQNFQKNDSEMQIIPTFELNEKNEVKMIKRQHSRKLSST